MIEKSLKIVAARIIDLECRLDRALMLEYSRRKVEDIEEWLLFNQNLLESLLQPQVTRRYQ